MNTPEVSTVTGSIILAIREQEEFINKIKYGEVSVRVVIHDGVAVSYEVTPTVKKRLDTA